MGLKPNLPTLTMETAHEVSARAHGDVVFTDTYLLDLNTPSHAFFHDMIIAGANELAPDDPELAERIRSFGCQLLYAADCAATVEDLRELFGKPLETA